MIAVRDGAAAAALVDRDRAAMLYAHGAGGLLVTVATSTVVVVLAVGPTLHRALYAWLAFMASVLLGRALDILLLRKLRLRKHPEGPAGRFEIACFATGALASAALWAVFPVIFFPVIGNTGRTAVAVVLAAMAGGGATVLGPSLPLSIAYTTAQLLPASVMFLLTPGRDNHFLGSFGIGMLIAMIGFARIAHHTVVSALALSRANEVLVTQAEQQQRATEAANQDLAAAQVALNEANDSLERRIAARTADLEREVAERQRYAEALARLASTDPLTGLANRANFAERLACMLAEAEAHGTALAVLFIDLDNFKQVNDVRGHTTGDFVLQTAARLLNEQAGGVAQVARWGGDEFVVAMPDAGDAAAARRLAENLRAALVAPLNAGLENIRIDATVGIALFPGDGRTQDELIRAADVAMYEAKKEGKGRIQRFDPTLAHNIAERHGLEQALRAAIQNNELSLAFQPIISASTGACDAFEALVRWNHPRHGQVRPDLFIPIAEQSGQIQAIGRFVLLEACRAAASWPGNAPAVTVNVSVAQVLSGSLLDDVTAALHATGLPATRLQLEITESMFLGDHVRVTPVFEELRRRGLRILLDDFGTGYSSLAYLGKLPLDVIKIDQSFVRAGPRDRYAVIRAILSIARALSLQVTAEGVETDSQRRVLTLLGVDRLQGYLLGRPVPQAAVMEWLVERMPVALKKAG